MASSDWFKIKITGKQTHGAYPWLGIDPIVTASQIVLGLQTIISRNLNIAETGQLLVSEKLMLEFEAMLSLRSLQ
jgi:metal-dependent amidase/aminoacylase/carboxypeptidase family protein